MQEWGMHHVVNASNRLSLASIQCTEDQGGSAEGKEKVGGRKSCKFCRKKQCGEMPRLGSLLVELLLAVGVCHLALDVGQDRSVGLMISHSHQQQ